MNKVVCIRDLWFVPDGPPVSYPTPKQGEIYKPIHSFEDDGKSYYVFLEFKGSYNAEAFRPVDDTFGPAMAEIIEKQLELEEAEKLTV